MELAVPGLKWCVYRLKKWKGMKVAWTRDPFKVEKKFMRNVYFQVRAGPGLERALLRSLVTPRLLLTGRASAASIHQGLLWISIPYFPLMAFVMPLILFVEFKFDKAFLLRVCNKTTSPFQGDLSTLLVFHTATMFIFVGLWVYAFVQQYFAVDTCGPFWDATITANWGDFGDGEYGKNLTVAAFVDAQVDGLGGALGSIVYVVYDLGISNAYLLWILLFALGYLCVDRGHRAAVLQEYVDDREAAVETLKMDVADKKEKLDRMREKLRLQNQRMGEMADAPG